MRLIASLAFTITFFGYLHAGDILLDSKASSLRFTGHTFLHDFKGEAKGFSGTAQFDAQRPEIISTARIVIQASKMTTFNSGRDRNMFRWLKVDQNPEIYFDLTRVISMDGKARSATKDRPSLFMVFGNLSLNKVSRPMQVQVSGWREGKLLLITGHTEINTFNHGLPILKKFWMSVDKEVDVDFFLGFSLTPELQMH